MKISGSCYCKKIRLTGTIDSKDTVGCHCVDCQIFSGAPFRAVVLCKREDLQILGKVQEFVKIGGSGAKRIQGFCGKCGTHIFATDEHKKIYNLRVGCLDQRPDLIPSKHIFGSSSLGWIHKIKSCTWHENSFNSGQYAFKKPIPKYNA